MPSFISISSITKWTQQQITVSTIFTDFSVYLSFILRQQPFYRGNKRWWDVVSVSGKRKQL